MKRRKHDAYERLAIAFDRNTGVRLSADDVQSLVLMDEAINQAVADILGDLDEEGED